MGVNPATVTEASFVVTFKFELKSKDAINAACAFAAKRKEKMMDVKNRIWANAPKKTGRNHFDQESRLCTANPFRTYRPFNRFNRFNLDDARNASFRQSRSLWGDCNLRYLAHSSSLPENKKEIEPISRIFSQGEKGAWHRAMAMAPGDGHRAMATER
jgi:hypothetical protein